REERPVEPNQVVARGEVHEVIDLAALMINIEEIAAWTAEQPILTVEAPEEVVAGAALENLVALTAVEKIVAAEAKHAALDRRAENDVGLRGADLVDTPEDQALKRLGAPRLIQRDIRGESGVVD